MIRFDRALTLALAKPLITAMARIRPHGHSERTLPVLMYHSISNDREPEVSPYYRTVTSPNRFGDQMRWLAASGYRGVSLAEGLAWLDGAAPTAKERASRSRVPSARPPVALTIDDGFADFHASAFPRLKDAGFTATIYLATGFVDNGSLLHGRACLNWTQVRDLQHEGMEIGSHTVTHPKLVDLRAAKVEHELRDSKAKIENEIGAPVNSFAYPYAFPQQNLSFVQSLREALRSTGYETCVTTEIGRVNRGDDRLRLKRLPINEEDDQALLEAKLMGAYDWLSWPQRLAKRVKATSVAKEIL